MWIHLHIEDEHLTFLEVLRFSQFILFQAKPNCLIFLDNDTVVVGGESKEAQVCDINWSDLPGAYVVGLL